MKGSLKFGIRERNIDMGLLNMETALERKMGLIDKDYDVLYQRHYNFKATKKNVNALIEDIKKFQSDLVKYEEILRRYIKYKGGKSE